MPLSLDAAPGKDWTEDIGLVQQTLRSSKAYCSLVKKYEPPLRRYVTRMLGRNSRFTDDVLQEAFIKAYVNLNDYDEQRPFAPWLYRIAHNEAVDQLRKNKNADRSVGGEDGELLLQALIHDGVLVPQPGLSHAIENAFTALAPAYREVLILRMLEERSYDEISEILAIPAGTVAIRIKRGQARLQASLKAWKD